MTQLETLLDGHCPACTYPIRFPSQTESLGGGRIQLTSRCNMCGKTYASVFRLKIAKTELEK